MRRISFLISIIILFFCLISNTAYASVTYSSESIAISGDEPYDMQRIYDELVVAIGDEATAQEYLNETEDKVWVLTKRMNSHTTTKSFINSTTVRELRFEPPRHDGYNHGLYGNWTIDGVKIISWNSTTNTPKIFTSYAPLIINGNVTNTEIAGLGNLYIGYPYSPVLIADDGLIIENITLHHIYNGMSVTGDRITVNNITIFDNHPIFGDGLDGCVLNNSRISNVNIHNMSDYENPATGSYPLTLIGNNNIVHDFFINWTAYSGTNLHGSNLTLYNFVVLYSGHNGFESQVHDSYFRNITVMYSDAHNFFQVSHDSELSRNNLYEDLYGVEPGTGYNFIITDNALDTTIKNMRFEGRGVDITDSKNITVINCTQWGAHGTGASGLFINRYSYDFNENHTIIDSSFSNNTAGYMDVWHAWGQNTRIINTRYTTRAINNGDFTRYYYPDIVAKDREGTAIENATIVIINENNTEIHAVNGYGDDRTSFPTNNGRTYRPNESRELSPAIAEYKTVYGNGNTYFNWTITGRSLNGTYTNDTYVYSDVPGTESGYNKIYPDGNVEHQTHYIEGNVSGVRPNSTWYRVDPSTPNNTIDIILNETKDLQATNWTILPAEGYVIARHANDTAITISSDTESNTVQINNTISALSNRSVALLVDGRFYAATISDDYGFVSFTYTGGFSEHEFALEEYVPVAPTINAYSCNKTNDQSLYQIANIGNTFRFNATSDQTVNWTWYLFDIQKSAGTDNYTYTFDHPGITRIKVNGTNENGSTETLIWQINVYDRDYSFSVYDSQIRVNTAGFATIGGIAADLNNTYLLDEVAYKEFDLKRSIQYSTPKLYMNHTNTILLRTNSSIYFPDHDIENVTVYAWNFTTNSLNQAKTVQIGHTGYPGEVSNSTFYNIYRIIFSPRDNSLFRNNRIYNAHIGLQIYNYAGDNILIENNTFHVWQSGIIWGSNNTIIRNNRVYCQYYDSNPDNGLDGATGHEGIWPSQRNYNTIIEGNYINNSGWNGLALGGSTNIIASNNIVENAWHNNLDLHATINATVINNTFRYGRTDGSNAILFSNVEVGRVTPHNHYFSGNRVIEPYGWAITSAQLHDSEFHNENYRGSVIFQTCSTASNTTIGNVKIINSTIDARSSTYTVAVNEFCPRNKSATTIAGDYYVIDSTLFNSTYSFDLYHDYTDMISINSNHTENYRFWYYDNNIRRYYYLDTYTKDQENNPLPNMTLRITNQNHNTFTSMNLEYENSRTFTTGTNAHTGTPWQDNQNTIVMLDYAINKSGRINMTHTIEAFDTHHIWNSSVNTVYPNGTIIQHTPLAIITGIDPNSTWYRSNPSTAPVTIELKVEANYTRMNISIQTEQPLNITVNRWQPESTGVKVNFTAETTNGNNASITICNLTTNTDYLIKKDSVNIDIETADIQGCITFSNQQWSEHEFTIEEAPESIYNISGYITDINGTQMQEVQVSAGYNRITNTTGSDGHYTIHNLPNGTYNITASKTGYLTNSTLVTITNTNIDNINMTLSVDPRYIYPTNITINNPVNHATLVYTTTSVTLNITTDETAICRYNTTTPNFNYTESTNMTSTNSHTHIMTINVSAGNTYTYYYKCNDSQGNINENPTTHTFSIASTPTSTSSGGGSTSSSSSGGAALPTIPPQNETNETETQNPITGNIINTNTTRDNHTDDTQDLKEEAAALINEAEALIKQYKGIRYIDEAQERLDEAISAYDDEEYENAIMLAKEAKELVLNAEEILIPADSRESGWIKYIIFGLIFAVIIGKIIYFQNKLGYENKPVNTNSKALDTNENIDRDLQKRKLDEIEAYIQQIEPIINNMDNENESSREIVSKIKEIEENISLARDIIKNNNDIEHNIDEITDKLIILKNDIESH